MTNPSPDPPDLSPAEVRNTVLGMARDSARLLVRSESAFFRRSVQAARTGRDRDLIRREFARDWAIVSRCSLEDDLEALADLGLAAVGTGIREEADRAIDEAREARCRAEGLDPRFVALVGVASREEAADAGRN